MKSHFKNFRLHLNLVNEWSGLSRVFYVNCFWSELYVIEANILLLINLVATRNYNRSILSPEDSMLKKRLGVVPWCIFVLFQCFALIRLCSSSLCLCIACCEIYFHLCLICLPDFLLLHFALLQPGYERLCCLRCIQTRDHNFATTCVCRVPKHLREEQVIECVHCGCRGCASGD